MKIINIQKRYIVIGILVVLVVLLSGCVSSDNTVEEFRKDHTPGLKRAQDLNLVVEPGIKQKLGKKEITLNIEKVWYNSNEIYVFYSLNPYPKGLAGVSFKLQNPDDYELVPLPGYSGGYPREKQIIDNTYYDRLTFNPLKDENGELLEQVEDVILSDIILNYENKVDFVKDVKIKVPVDFDKEKEIEKNYNLDQEIDVLGRKLTLKKLTLGMGENELIGSFQGKEGEQFYNLIGEIITKDNDKRRFNSIFADGNDFHLTFEPFDQIPDELHLELNQLTLLGTDEVSFKLDTIPYQQSG